MANVITSNIDNHPYVGIRNVVGKVRFKDLTNNSYIRRYFDGTPDVEQIRNITPGKIYDVVKVEGYGDCEDITILDDIGSEQRLMAYFFEEVNERSWY